MVRRLRTTAAGDIDDRPGAAAYSVRAALGSGQVHLTDILLPIAFMIVALLYAAVGQAGGTGYVAVMGVLGLAPDVIKPAALALNVLVAGIGCWHFYRVGLLTWRTCFPFAILGAPFSLLGGATNLPRSISRSLGKQHPNPSDQQQRH